MNAALTYRRALHRIPELGHDLPETTTLVRSVLAPLRCTVTEPCPGAVCAFFDAGAKNTLAFRADLDALPVTERTDSAYTSCHPGKMHACGHDGHTAMLLALAEEISAYRGTLPHNLLLLFQPAEETTGGAKALCDTGILALYRVSAVFGLHLWPGLAAGQLATRPGPLMARSCEVDIAITGKSAHIAKAAEGADAAEAAARLLLSAYRMASTELPETSVRLLKFGAVSAGTVRNALAASATMQGSLRTFYDADFRFLQRRLTELAAEADAATGCVSRVRFSEGYPAVCNDEALTARVFARLPELCLLPEPSMTAEDFSFYGQRVPSLFCFLGTGREIPLHADTFDFDEATLEAGVEFYKKLLFSL